MMIRRFALTRRFVALAMMIVVGLVFIALAIIKDYEPLLLLPSRLLHAPGAVVNVLQPPTSLTNGSTQPLGCF